MTQHKNNTLQIKSQTKPQTKPQTNDEIKKFQMDYNGFSNMTFDQMHY
jgi:hypothetical protein